MADNITIPTTGTGTATPVVATDDVSGVHYQRVKLDGGGDGVAAPIGGDATNGLDVDVTRLPALAAGTNNIGDVDVLSIAAGDNNIGNVDIVTMPNVTIGAALPAGTNAIGKLSANSGVDIGDVDITSITPGSSAANLGKAEDAAHSSGDVGVMALAVRNDANTALAGTDGDYSPIGVNADGSIKAIDVKVVDLTITRPSDTTAYAAGDAIADSTSTPTAFNATGFARNNLGSGRITSVTLVNSVAAATPANLELWIFDAAYTNNNDNAAWSPSDANANTCLGIVQFGGNPISGVNNAIYNAQGLDIPYACLTTTTLWFALVVRNAYTPTSAEVFKVRVGVERYG